MSKQMVRHMFKRKLEIKSKVKIRNWKRIWLLKFEKLWDRR